MDDLAAIHELALQRFDEASSAQQELRAQSLAARRFVAIPGAMWEDPQWADTFANTVRVEINKAARGLEKILNDYRANRVTVSYRAVGGEASEEDAELLEGLHRADAYHFKSRQARDNAFMEAASGGYGAYRLRTEWSDATDPKDDTKRVNPGDVIVDADQRVYFDLNSKLYDKADAEWCIVMTGYTRRAFETEWPGRHSSWPEGIWKPAYDWFAPDMMFVAEYYLRCEVSDTLLVMTPPLILADTVPERAWLSDFDEGSLDERRAMGWKIEQRRRVKRQRVKKYIMSGAEVLDDDVDERDRYIAGDMIPVVPVYGHRFFVDNQERWRGHVQLAMDPCRVYNAAISKMVEMNALSPREVPIFTPDQVAGLEDHWAGMNVERHPYALVNPILGPDGAMVPTGPISYIKPPDVPPVVAGLLQVMANDIAELTGMDNNADQVRANVSAEAMEIAATRVDERSETYMDNMRQSVQREGELYQKMAGCVYFEKGRIVETMNEDNRHELVKLVQQTTVDGVSKVRNDVTRGRYAVVADVTEATATRRDKTVRASMMGAQQAASMGNQELGNAFLMTAVLNMDGEGISDLKKWVRAKAVVMGLVEPTPEEAQKQAELAQQAKPDPSQMLAEAQVMLAESQAMLNQARAAETQAKLAKVPLEAEKLEADTVKTLTDAEVSAVNAGISIAQAGQQTAQVANS